MQYSEYLKSIYNPRVASIREKLHTSSIIKLYDRCTHVGDRRIVDSDIRLIWLDIMFTKLQGTYDNYSKSIVVDLPTTMVIPNPSYYEKNNLCISVQGMFDISAFCMKVYRGMYKDLKKDENRITDEFRSLVDDICATLPIQLRTIHLISEVRERVSSLNTQLVSYSSTIKSGKQYYRILKTRELINGIKTFLSSDKLPWSRYQQHDISPSVTEMCEEALITFTPFTTLDPIDLDSSSITNFTSALELISKRYIRITK